MAEATSISLGVDVTLSPWTGLLGSSFCRRPCLSSLLLTHSQNSLPPPRLPATSFSTVFILHMLMWDPHSALAQVLPRTLSVRTGFKYDPSLHNPSSAGLSCQVEVGIVSSEDLNWIEPLSPLPWHFPIHSAWLLSVIIKLVVIFLMGLQTLISFHSEYQSTEETTLPAEPKGDFLAEPRELWWISRPLVAGVASVPRLPPGRGHCWPARGEPTCRIKESEEKA